jgi:hypothetical protein
MNKMTKVKIRLTTDRGTYVWLTIDYFPKRRGGGVNTFWITENARWATAVPLKQARKWMREAKYLAGYDGDVIEKGEYILNGKPTTLAAAGLKTKRRAA